MAYCELKEGNWIATKEFILYLKPAQILDNTMDEYVVFGFGRIECGSEVKTYVHGAVITTIPSEIIPLEDEYVKFIYKPGSVFCKGTRTVKDSTYVEMYYNISLNGKLPTNIPALKHIKIRDNVHAKNKHLDIPRIYLDVYMSYILKDKANPLKEHRLNPNGEYIVMNPRESVATSGGTFGAATYEDPRAMMMINITRKESEEAESALEKYALM